MYQKKKYIQNLILYISDILSLLISYAGANFIWLGMVKGFVVMRRAEVFDSIGMLLMSYIFVVFFFNVNRDFIKRKIYEEFLYCLKMNAIFAALFAILLFIAGDANSASRGVYVITVFLNILLMFTFHLVIRYYLVKIYKNNKKNTQMFVITTEDRADKVISNMKRNIEWSNRIQAIAIIDKDMTGAVIHNIRVRATYDTMVNFVKDEAIDEVFIDVPYDTGNTLRPFIMDFENMGVTVHLNIEMLEAFDDFNKSLSMLGDVPVVTFANNFYDVNKLMIKRLIDIVGSIVGIIITLVVTVFLAPVLLIESRGPLIFKQKRVGRNGRYFYVYKFRSMYRDAEERKKALMEKNEMKGLMFKMTDDPRITKVGKFIRKTSIDELPQFFNVFLGDMSLVGTRPPTVDEFKQYEGYHKRRLSMKPGLTGMWQVSGRSDIEDFEEVVKLDLQYIDNWSIGLDFKILLKTVFVVFKHGGAK